MIHPPDPPEQPAVASIDHHTDFGGGTLSPYGREHAGDLRQSGNGVQSRDDDPLGGGQQRRGPLVRRKRKIDENMGEAPRHFVEQSGERLQTQVANLQRTARRSEDYEPARMTACKNVKEVIVEPFRRLQYLLDLNLRRDVQVVAHVARLEVEVDQGDPAVLTALALEQLDGRLDRERRIAHAARARDKAHHDRPRKRSCGAGYDAAKDVERLARQSRLG